MANSRTSARWSFQHSVQMRNGKFDVQVLPLTRSWLCRKHPAPVDVLEIAVGELIPALVVFVWVIIDAEIPAPVFTEAMRLDVRILLLGRGLMLAPGVPVVDHVVSVFEQAAGLIECLLLHCHLPPDHHGPASSEGLAARAGRDEVLVASSQYLQVAEVHEAPRSTRAGSCPAT